MVVVLAFTSHVLSAAFERIGTKLVCQHALFHYQSVVQVIVPYGVHDSRHCRMQDLN